MVRVFNCSRGHCQQITIYMPRHQFFIKINTLPCFVSDLLCAKQCLISRPSTDGKNLTECISSNFGTRSKIIATLDLGAPTKILQLSASAMEKPKLLIIDNLFLVLCCSHLEKVDTSEAMTHWFIDYEIIMIRIHEITSVRVLRVVPLLFMRT